MTDSQKIVEGLNDLLEKNYDAEKGYKTAADNTDSTRLKSFFQSHAEQRYGFGHQIKDAIAQLGGEPDKGGSVTGAVHRGWINFKSALSLSDEEAILEECERGEINAVNAYDEFLRDHNLPVWLSKKIYDQRNGIARSLTKVQVMEEQYD